MMLYHKNCFVLIGETLFADYGINSEVSDSKVMCWVGLMRSTQRPLT